MLTMREILSRRDAIRGELKGLLEKPDSELSDEQRSRADVLEKEANALNDQERRQALIDDMDRRARGTPVDGGGTDTRWAKLLDGFSISKAIMSGDKSVDAGREREVSAEIEKRIGRRARGVFIPPEAFIERRAGQIVGDDTLGGYLVPDRYRGDLLIDRLRSASILNRLGVTWLNDIVAPVTIPRLTTSGSVQWVGENQEPDESQAKFGAITLTPKTAAASMSYSRRTLLGATPSIDALLRDDIARQTAAAIDVAAINGTGVRDPLGLLNTPGLAVTSLGTNGGLFTSDQLIDLSVAPDLVDGAGDAMAWVTTPKAVGAISKLKDGQGDYLWRGTLAAGLGTSLLGYPMVKSNSVPRNLVKGSSGANCHAMIFGAWSSMIVAQGPTDVLSDPFSRGASGQVRIYAFTDSDIGIRHIESWAAFKDIVLP